MLEMPSPLNENKVETEPRFIELRITSNSRWVRHSPHDPTIYHQIQWTLSCHVISQIRANDWRNKENFYLFPQIGNALVCLAVYTNHSMRTVTNIFIVNLAVADFFVILLCLPPTIIWDVTETWFLGEVLCKVVIYFQVCVEAIILVRSFVLSLRLLLLSLSLLIVLFTGVFVYPTKITNSCPISLPKKNTKKRKKIAFKLKCLNNEN